MALIRCKNGPNRPKDMCNFFLTYKHNKGCNKFPTTWYSSPSPLFKILIIFLTHYYREYDIASPFFRVIFIHPGPGQNLPQPQPPSASGEFKPNRNNCGAVESQRKAKHAVQGGYLALPASTAHNPGQVRNLYICHRRNGAIWIKIFNITFKNPSIAFKRLGVKCRFIPETTMLKLSSTRPPCRTRLT